jgi:hypothetical protein
LCGRAASPIISTHRRISADLGHRIGAGVAEGLYLAISMREGGDERHGVAVLSMGSGDYPNVPNIAMTTAKLRCPD